ncbi:MAG: helix-turn-helix domain-containing protein [Candidatus Thermoplasmatota archaeon]|jgi:putative transcriptional regulator|nr:helix-turn-helix domain-containing protein [Candidatus Sysuiplasma jiujiangense]MBX8639193.1 helix-turn-helix domain-containing protein [Candidatus Sysuiplasma jiujiangense]MBX8642571.1 helix-turn-helix domain-containing protein [Candidatus Sysuiplasma jiujiangense]MCL4317813.1 helix-turn-helix domain-containing protein [Candidatus Thermoplasmatota archaeon]MCL5254242.1 helix-turn-helix domain-containing protein [Candidatus Thermoplasmatota archaeon]
MHSALKEKIAGEIVLSADPGRTMKKWREEFHLSQLELSRELKISASVISDYESGRRKSPGASMVRRYVEAMISLELRSGGRFIKRFDTEATPDYLLSMREFSRSIHLDELISAIDAENLSKEVSTDRYLHGYTLLDSIKAITSLGSADYLKIFGWSSQRALIFTSVKFGRSPMIAVRAHPMKPAAVVYHRPENIDQLAILLSKLENIPLLRSDIEQRDMIEILEKFGDENSDVRTK